MTAGKAGKMLWMMWSVFWVTVTVAIWRRRLTITSRDTDNTPPVSHRQTMSHHNPSSSFMSLHTEMYFSTLSSWGVSAWLVDLCLLYPPNEVQLSQVWCMFEEFWSCLIFQDFSISGSGGSFQDNQVIRRRTPVTWLHLIRTPIFSERLKWMEITCSGNSHLE